MLTRTQAKPSTEASKAAVPPDVLKDALADKLIVTKQPTEVITAGPRGTEHRKDGEKDGDDKADAKKADGSGTSTAAATGPTNLSYTWDDGSSRKDRGRDVIGSTHHKLHLDPKQGVGSAFVVNGARSESTVSDAYSTVQAYQGYKKEHPDWSEEMLWAMATREDFNPGGDVLVAQPDVSKSDATTKEKANYRSGRKYAWVIGNHDYTHSPYPWGDLEGAKADAARMASSFKAQGYEVVHVKDVNSTQIKGGFDVFPSKAKAGDEVVLYYAGHGLEEGLAGVDANWRTHEETYPDGTKWKWSDMSDTFPHTNFGSYAAKAVSGGWHLKIIVDACHSEGASGQVMSALHENTMRYEKTPLEANTKELAEKGLLQHDGRKHPANLQDYYEKRYDDKL